MAAGTPGCSRCTTPHPRANTRMLQLPPSNVSGTVGPSWAGKNPLPVRIVVVWLRYPGGDGRSPSFLPFALLHRASLSLLAGPVGASHISSPCCVRFLGRPFLHFGWRRRNSDLGWLHPPRPKLRVDVECGWANGERPRCLDDLFNSGSSMTKKFQHDDDESLPLLVPAAALHRNGNEWDNRR